uniref:SPOC domain-containing protein n=1 Tax=Heterorhabditis bacteriophora TaxID=37862 RepID=A0A1I7X843_HETBA
MELPQDDVRAIRTLYAEIRKREIGLVLSIMDNKPKQRLICRENFIGYVLFESTFPKPVRPVFDPMMRPRLSLVTLISVLFIRAEGQQTFQNTRFDLPANLPVEDPTVLAQLEGDTIYQNKDSLKPVKVNKSVLRLNPQPAQTVISVPSPTPTANIPPIAPLHPFIPHGVPSIPQQPLQTLQHQFAQPFPSAPQPIEQATLEQSSLIHQTAVPQSFINSSPPTDQHPSFYQPTPSQFSLVSQRNLPAPQPLVPQLTGQQIQQGVLQQQFLHAQHEASNVSETVQQPEQAEIPELVQPQLVQSSHIAKSEYRKEESSLQNNNGPTRTSIWFNEKYNTAG